jgi:hypothetical protein
VPFGDASKRRLTPGLSLLWKTSSLVEKSEAMFNQKIENQNAISYVDMPIYYKPSENQSKPQIHASKGD